MTNKQIDRVIRSTVHIIMSSVPELLPKGLGSGVLLRYDDYNILLTAAHVTDVDAATCIDLMKVTNKGSNLYAVGAMSYLAKFDMDRFEEQLAQLKVKPARVEESDFGQVDLSFVKVPKNLEIVQRDFLLEEIKIKKGVKQPVDPKMVTEPSLKKTYSFFGRIKPSLLPVTPVGPAFETQEIFYPGVKFIRKIGHYFEFELSSPIADHADFKGTSGAPVMDSTGNIVSLITHGYEGDKLIYGIALSDFLPAAAAMIADEK